jgi:transcriptional regulator with XRE-family HTH domain
MTYTGCKPPVKAELRALVLSGYTGCRIFAAMSHHKTYIREWRTFRGLTQDQAVDRLAALDDPHVPTTAASLSRLENGKQPYSQRSLEALAQIYDCEPDELLGRDPTKEGRVIDFMKHLDSAQQAQALAILKAFTQSVA